MTPCAVSVVFHIGHSCLLARQAISWAQEAKAWEGNKRLPGDINEASGHGALLAVLVALDGDAVEVARLPGHPAGCVHVLAHHDLPKDLRAQQGLKVYV